MILERSAKGNREPVRAFLARIYIVRDLSQCFSCIRRLLHVFWCCVFASQIHHIGRVDAAWLDVMILCILCSSFHDVLLVGDIYMRELLVRGVETTSLVGVLCGLCAVFPCVCGVCPPV